MTTRLSDVVDLDELEREVADGYVRRQFNPADPDLKILNYSERAQYERRWTDVTKRCRGLIYRESDGVVLARPFEKFPNFDESGWSNPPKGPVLRTPKADGSLGILYWVDGEPFVATRGSFASEQARRGTRIFREMLESVDPETVRSADKTFLFEIIYPENRIVVNYGDLEALVLLDVIDIATGFTDLDGFENADWPLKADRVLLPSFLDTMQADVPPGEEGFVFLWPAHNRRVKMKSSEYVHLHRLVTGLNERVVWEQLGHGRSVQQICEPLPDELHHWVRDVATRLLVERTRIMTDAQFDFTAAKKQLDVEHGEGAWNRGQFARAVSMNPNRAFLFNLLDGKDFSDAVWKLLRPTGGQGPRTITEDVA